MRPGRRALKLPAGDHCARLILNGEILLVDQNFERLPQQCRAHEIHAEFVGHDTVGRQGPHNGVAQAQALHEGSFYAEKIRDEF